MQSYDLVRMWFGSRARTARPACRADAFIIATEAKAAEPAGVPVNGRTIVQEQ
jgi:hypothetical protein